MPEPNERDEKCGCGKSLAARISKALHDNPGAVPASLSHLVPNGLTGAEALQHLQGLAALESAGGNGGAARGAPGADLGVTAHAADSPSVYAGAKTAARYDAGRGPLGYVPQRTGGAGPAAKGGRR
jgi:hypothetical protein